MECLKLKPEVGLSTGDFERQMKGPLGMGRLTLKRFTEEGLKGGLLYWVPWIMKGRLWRQVSLFIGGSVGQPEVGSSTGDFERQMKGPLGMRPLTLKRFTAKDLKRGLLYWVPWIMKERLWRQVSLFTGGSVGQPGVGSSTRDFERWVKGALVVECLSLYGSSVKETWREGALAGDPGG
jgi:hypothetical protein